jgi:ABC-2 type transport system ATP-binding protein
MELLMEMELVQYLYPIPRAVIASAKRRKKSMPKRGVIEASLRIESGSIVGLVGPNGAGKSTLISIMAGILPIQNGIIRSNGNTVRSEEERVNLRSRIGLMPERVAWSGPATPLDVIQRLCIIRGLPKENAESILERVGLSSRARDRLSSLSQGMRQRLSLGASLIGDPEILLLDEPMNGLDPVAQNAFRTMIREMAEKGKAIIVSSHQLNELERFVESIAIMNHGKIVTQGSFTSVEHDLGVGQRLLISGIGPSPASSISENPLITVTELDEEGDWCLRLTRHDQTWSQDLRAALIERINVGNTRVASVERIPPDLEEILRTATGISEGINLQEEE